MDDHPNWFSGRSLAVDPTDPDVVYGGGYHYKSEGSSAIAVAKTTDGWSESWTITPLNSHRGQVYSVAVDPKDPRTVYAGGHYRDDGGVWHIALFKTTNGGEDWLDVSSGLDDDDQPVHTLAIDPDSTSTVYVGTHGGIYRTSDAGSNWSNINCGFDRVNALLILPSSSATIYAATAQGVYRSTDRGSNWSLANGGLTHINVSTLGVGAAPTERVYAGTLGGGVFGQDAVGVDECDSPSSVSDHITLHQSRPNPFSTICSIRYSLPSRAQVSLKVYDITGRFVCELVNALQSSGIHTAEWDGRDQYGRPVPSNVYFYRLRGGQFSVTRKMLLVR